MTHTELCKLTAERFVEKGNSKLALYEVSMSLMEKPDVLVLGASTVDLFEIKMSRSDFLADFKKRGRKHPLFGFRRYFVCNGDFIKPEEVPEGWGLYYYKNDKFYLQKGSTQFFREKTEKSKQYDLLYSVLMNLIICRKTNFIISKRYTDMKSLNKLED